MKVFGGARPQPVQQTSSWSCPLTLYEDPPLGPITLHEFESFAFDRLELLRKLDSRLSDGTWSKLGRNERNDRVYELERSFRQSEETDRQLLHEAYLRKDLISHFTLRLAFCHTEELRSWFRRMEAELFRARFEASSPDKQDAFLEAHSFKHVECDADEVARLEHLLSQLAVHKPDNLYYKVRFQKALPLIGRRRILVRGGWAYVPKSDLVALIMTSFKSSLSASLVVAAQAMATKQYDERLEILLKQLSVQELNPSYKRQSSGSITPDEIPALAVCLRFPASRNQPTHVVIESTYRNRRSRCACRTCTRPLCGILICVMAAGSNSGSSSKAAGCHWSTRSTSLGPSFRGSRVPRISTRRMRTTFDTITVAKGNVPTTRHSLAIISLTGRRRPKGITTAAHSGTLTSDIWWPSYDRGESPIVRSGALHHSSATSTTSWPVVSISRSHIVPTTPNVSATIQTRTSKKARRSSRGHALPLNLPRSRALFVIKSSPCIVTVPPLGLCLRHKSLASVLAYRRTATH